MNSVSPLEALIREARRLARQIATLKEREYDLIRRMHDAGYSDQRIADELGRGRAHVYRVRTGQRGATAETPRPPEPEAGE